MNRINRCRACFFYRQGVKTRIAIPHTCGKSTKELKSMAVMDAVVDGLTNGKGLRSYSSVDLIRFHNFKNANPEMSMLKAIKEYNEKHPELSAVEKLKNASEALGIDLNKLTEQ